MTTTTTKPRRRRGGLIAGALVLLSAFAGTATATTAEPDPVGVVNDGTMFDNTEVEHGVVDASVTPAELPEPAAPPELPPMP